ncbi:MAG: phosphate ABC transporter, permease protein PstA, partial [Thalassolituus sp. CG17_big_fil_post_rev_8_21_14_2_50_53_8]
MADRLFSWLILGCAVLVVVSLLWVLGDVLIEGVAHFSWSFLVAEPV